MNPPYCLIPDNLELGRQRDVEDNFKPWLEAPERLMAPEACRGGASTNGHSSLPLCPSVSLCLSPPPPPPARLTCPPYLPDMQPLLCGHHAGAKLCSASHGSGPKYRM